MSPRAFGVLSNLTGPSSQTQQQLADALGMHRNNMVGLIDEMEAAGWVRRHRSPQDRRAFEVRLTSSGSTFVARVTELIPALEGQLGQALTESERHAMVRLLKQLACGLDLAPGVHPHLRARSR